MGGGLWGEYRGKYNEDPGSRGGGWGWLIFFLLLVALVFIGGIMMFP